MAISQIAHALFRKYEPTDAYTLFVLLGALPALPVALSVLRAPLSSTLLSILSAYSTFYVSFLLSITAYRVSPFHPLYQYPGPFIAKLSNFYGAYIAAKGKQHLHFKRMHEKYGPIVRLGTFVAVVATLTCDEPQNTSGPNVLSIVDVDLLPSLLDLPRGPSEFKPSILSVTHD